MKVNPKIKKRKLPRNMAERRKRKLSHTLSPNEEKITFTQFLSMWSDYTGPTNRLDEVLL